MESDTSTEPTTALEPYMYMQTERRTSLGTTLQKSLDSCEILRASLVFFELDCAREVIPVFFLKNQKFLSLAYKSMNRGFYQPEQVFRHLLN